MSLRISQYVVLAALCAAIIAETALFGPMLPMRIATHFDGSGLPNGWMSGTAFVREITIIAVIAVAGFLAAGLIPKIPARWINIPSRDYWLAPERQAAALGFVRDWVRGFLLFTIALLAGVHGLVLQANLIDPPQLGSTVFWILGAYGIATLAMLAAIIWRFSLKKT